jgi:type I restriction enzyme M protein
LPKANLSRIAAFFELQLSAAFKSAGIDLDARLKTCPARPGAPRRKRPQRRNLPRQKRQAGARCRPARHRKRAAAGRHRPALPLDYEGKKNKGKVDVAPLLALVEDHCEAYLAAEVLPYRPDAWIAHDKIKVGYEIPFNRHFYEYEPPRPLEAIEADILKRWRKDIMAMLKEVTA